MAAPVPTLGYPSRTAAVLALRSKFKSTKEIAELVGIEQKSVAALEISAARRVPRPSEQMGRTVVFPVDVLDALAPHAERRGISVNALARMIIETVADDDMVDAVLDDEGEIK